jgi:hypothetical protein
MSNTIFPVETSTVTVTPETASTFEGTFVSGAVAAVAGGMTATIPLEVAALVTICNLDFTEHAATYCISNILVGFLAMRLAYRTGTVPDEDYVKYLVKYLEHPVVENELVTWFETYKIKTDLSEHFKQLPEAFVLKHPDMIADSGSTVLTFACATNNTPLALAILATGMCKPEQINIYGDTALMHACNNGLAEVALAILATGKSNPGHINNYNNTALIHTCNNGLSEVALAILATGMGKPEQVSSLGSTALQLSTTRKLTTVVAELHRLGITK